MFPSVIYKTPEVWGMRPEYVDVYKAEEMIADLRKQGEGWGDVCIQDCYIYRLDTRPHAKVGIYHSYTEEWVALVPSERKGYYELAT